MGVLIRLLHRSRRSRLHETLVCYCAWGSSGRVNSAISWLVVYAACSSKYDLRDKFRTEDVIYTGRRDFYSGCLFASQYQLLSVHQYLGRPTACPTQRLSQVLVFQQPSVQPSLFAHGIQVDHHSHVPITSTRSDYKGRTWAPIAAVCVFFLIPSADRYCFKRAPNLYRCLLALIRRYSTISSYHRQSSPLTSVVPSHTTSRYASPISHSRSSLYVRGRVRSASPYGPLSHSWRSAQQHVSISPTGIPGTHGLMSSSR